MAVEDLDHLGEIRQRARQPVDLVDHDHIDPAVCHIGQKPLQRRSLHAPAREAAIVISFRQGRPTLAGLRKHIRIAGLSLGIKAVEFLLQPLFAALASVEGAADRGD